MIPVVEFYRCTEKDTPALSQLWQSVFGDSSEIINLFFDCFRGQPISYAAGEYGEIFSAFHLLPCKLITEKKNYQGSYLYAAATKPEKRGKGLMRSLISFAAQIKKREGDDFICLYPAEPSLYTYYARLGFLPGFSAAWTRENPYPKEDTQFSDAAAFAELRRSCLKTNFIELSFAALSFDLQMEEGENLFPDRTEENGYKCPITHARESGLEFQTKADGMLLPLQDELKNKNFSELYLGVNLN